MDSKRLRQAKDLAKQHFLRIETPEQLETAEELIEGAERSGESVYGRLRGRFRGHTKLLELTRALNAERDLERLLKKIVDAAIELCGAERGVLILGTQEPYSQEVARRFGGEDLVSSDLVFSRTIAGRVIAGNRRVTLDDALSDAELAQHPSVQQMRLRSILAVPLRARERLLGALYVDNRFAQGLFFDAHAEVLEALADQAAVAIENARLHRELEEKGRQVEGLNRQLEHKLTQRESELERMEGLLDNQRQQLAAHGSGYHDILGRSPRMREVFAVIEKLRSTDMPVLIQGESGTGKELAARAIHATSRRAGQPFVCENCAAIPESLLESELFGHVAGAFTGASKAKKGLFELADGGTLFLDEVADMSEQMQKKLLRALQEGEVRPIGGKAPVRVDVRVLSAANRSLKELVGAGRFREDLYFRLTGIMVHLPPLRERREDIQLLVEHFLARAAQGGAPKKIDRQALDALLAHDWPGNIRELENEIEAAAALSDGTIGVAHLSAGTLGVPAQGEVVRPLDQEIEAVEKKAILRALALCRNKSETADALQISRFTLGRKIEKYGIADPAP